MELQINRWIAGAVLALAPLVSSAQPGMSAYDVVQQTTDRVMAVVQEANNYADDDPERYFNELQVVLDDVVDFAYFSRSVMGGAVLFTVPCLPQAACDNSTQRKTGRPGHRSSHCREE